MDIVVTISKYRDERCVPAAGFAGCASRSATHAHAHSGNRLAASLEAVPEEANIPDLSFNVRCPLCICGDAGRLPGLLTVSALTAACGGEYLVLRGA